jgi:hypothetical protein
MAQQDTPQGQGQPQAQDPAQQAGPPPSPEHAQLRKHGIGDATIHQARAQGVNLGSLLNLVRRADAAGPAALALVQELLGLFGQGSGTQPAAGEQGGQQA